MFMPRRMAIHSSQQFWHLNDFAWWRIILMNILHDALRCVKKQKHTALNNHHYVEMPNTPSNASPDRLRQARQESGYTQEQVAERVGLTLNSISRYETGTASPSQVALNMLAVIYDKSVRWLLGEDESFHERPETPEEDLTDSEFLIRQAELLIRSDESGLTLDEAKTVRDFINSVRAQRHRVQEADNAESDERIC